MAPLLTRLAEFENKGTKFPANWGSVSVFAVWNDQSVLHREFVVSLRSLRDNKSIELRDCLIAQFLADGSIAALSNRAELCFFDAHGNQLHRSELPHSLWFEGPSQFERTQRLPPCFSADGSLLAWQAGEQLRILQTRASDGTTLLEWSLSAAISGEISALFLRGTPPLLYAWKRKEGLLCMDPTQPEGSVRCVFSATLTPQDECIAFSENETTMVLATRSKESSKFNASRISVWTSFADGSIAMVLERVFPRLVEAFAAISPDGTRVAICSNRNTIELIELSTGRTMNLYESNAEQIPFNGVSFASGTQNLWALIGTQLRCFRYTDGKLIDQEDQHGGAVTCLAFSPHGTHLASADTAGVVLLRELDAMSTSLWDRTPRGGRLAWSPDGTMLVTADTRAGATLWEASSGAALVGLEFAENSHRVVFSPDGSQVFIAGFGPGGIGSRVLEVRAWNIPSGSYVHRLEISTAHSSGHAALDVSERFIIAARATELRVWERSSFREHLRQSLPTAPFAASPPIGFISVALSTDEQFAYALEATGTLHILRLATKETRTLETLTGVVCAVFHMPSQLLWLANWKGEIARLDLRTETMSEKVQAGDEHLHAMAISPDGKTLAMAGKKLTTTLWTIEP